MHKHPVSPTEVLLLVFFDLFKVRKITTKFFDLFKVSKNTKKSPSQEAVIQGAAIQQANNQFFKIL